MSRQDQALSRFRRCFAAAILLALALTLGETASAARAMISGPVDDAARQALPGSIRPELATATDHGPVADALPMDHIILQLSGTPAQEQALQNFLASVSDPASSNYHHWMSASAFGEAFGAAASDIAAVSDWLRSYGFTINDVLPNHMAIDFSGTAESVRLAFHTEIHAITAKGADHIANVSDPTVPQALAPAIKGIVSLHDFSPGAKRRPHSAFTVTANGATQHLLAPADMATIYNLTPLFAAGITGQGQTIAVLEDSNLYSVNDWTTFRSSFGLASYSSGSLTTLHPASSSGSACGNPGVVAGDAQETTLDAEWASAAAPGAAVVVASCATTRSTFGGFIALQNLLNSSTPPPIVSISFGVCEAENGAVANQAINTLYAQAAAQGVSVFVAAGDEGAASCDAGATGATHGIGVSAYASTPYNVAVGGTDFDDTLSGTVSRYWSSANTIANYASALSYIPEIPWNDSCAGQLLATHLGYAVGYGAQGLCASAVAQQDQLQTVTAGSGGPSGCATGVPLMSGVVSGSCAGYAKPSWQSGSGVVNDQVRDIPDLSLFAGDGIWGHYYVWCYSNLRDQGASCSGSPANWGGGGGTSFATPIMAGIQALINQRTGSWQGNPNPVYYKLAALSGKSCAATGPIGSGCIFHNITTGDIDVDCAGSTDCYGAATSGTSLRFGSFTRHFATAESYDGALSLSSSAFTSAYAATSGWNFAAGLGSVNAYNLATNWSLVAP